LTAGTIFGKSEGVMHRFSPLRWLTSFLLSATLVGQSLAAREISLDGLVNWQNPLSELVKAFEERFPVPLAADARRQYSNGTVVIQMVNGDSADQFQLFGNKMKVTTLNLIEKEDASVSSIHIKGESTLNEIVAEMQKVYQKAPVMVKTRSAKGEMGEASSWRLSSHWVYVSEREGITSISVITPPTPTNSTPSAAMVAAARADLDFLLNTSEVWNCSSAKFETMYRARESGGQETAPQFEWLTAGKDRARFSRRMFSNVETNLTMFGGSVKVEEATVEFVNGRIARATVSVYNRGDSGQIEAAEFERLYKLMGQSLGQVFKVQPKSQLMSANAALKTVGWNWTTPQGIALLEYNDYSRGGRPEFLRLKLAAPDQADWSMGRLSVGVQRMGLVKNVTKTPGGDVYITGVPMVDQGAKGYCVAASCQRLFEYMQIPCDQHEMAQLLNVDAEEGANALEMQKSLAKVDSRFNVAFKPLVNPEVYYDVKGRRRVSLKEFAGMVKEHADKGVPLLWALQLGLAKEDPPLPNGGQVSGGHMRMIIGYNSAKNQILFTDSWGAGHELKRMDAAAAYEATVGLYNMAPRGM
jgi:hypothetical protein